MEYLYIVMFLQEIGREINEVNIQKIFNAVDVEADNDKVRLLILALSILTTENMKKAKRAAELSTVKQLNNLENRFEILKNSITKVDDRIGKLQKEKPVINAAKDIIQPESAVKTEPAECKNVDIESVNPVECKNTDTVSEVACQDKITNEQPARYVYGIADKGVKESLGKIGIDGAEVYTIPCKDLCIIVHDCSPEPYQSEDEDVVKNWLFTQQEVLDVVAEKFGVVLPMSFDMIIEGQNGNTAELEVSAWLEKSYDDFYEKVVKLRNRQEFGVQVIIDTEDLSKKLIEKDEKLREKKRDIETKPQGLAYMEKEVLKDMIKDKLEETADEYFREFYGIIKKCTDDIVIGKTKKVGGNKQMIMNLSCLVNKDKVGELGKELEKIEKKDGVSSVRFSGPWAPFSFVTPEKGGEK